MVAPVGHVDVAVIVHTDAGRATNLAVTAARCPVCGNELPLGGELLDAVIAPVGHVDVVPAVYTDTPGQVELARVRSGRPERMQELPVHRESLHSTVAGIDNEELIIGVDSQAARAVQLTVTGTALSPLAYELSIGGHDGDAVQVFVADEKPLFSVYDNRHRPDELAVALSPRTVRVDVLVVGVHQRYVDAPRVDVVAPAQNVQPTILTQRT